VYHFQDTTPEARIKQTHTIYDNAYLRHDGENLAAHLYLLRERHPAYYERIVAQIRLVAPFFDDFNLRRSPLDPNMIRLEWREKGSDAYLDAHMLSDGTLRFICLTALLLQPETMLPAVILIDEPELGLHPYAIRQFAGMVRSISAFRPVIIATQSVTLVNQFAPENIVVVSRAQGQSTFERLDADALDAWLDEYGVGELWEKNVIEANPSAWVGPK
jgi:predicted ATPase